MEGGNGTCTTCLSPMPCYISKKAELIEYIFCRQGHWPPPHKCFAHRKFVSLPRMHTPYFCCISVGMKRYKIHFLPMAAIGLKFGGWVAGTKWPRTIPRIGVRLIGVSGGGWGEWHVQYLPITFQDTGGERFDDRLKL